MKKGRFLWSAHRITERQKAGKARNIKGKQLKNSRSTVSKQLVALRSSASDNRLLRLYQNGSKSPENQGLIVTSNYFVAENGVTRRSRRFSVFIGCLRDDRLGNNGNIYIVHEVEENLHFLLALAAGFVRGIDDDFLDILVHDGLCQLLHIHIFLCQGDKGIQTVVHFFPLFHPFFDNFNFELLTVLLRFHSPQTSFCICPD